MIEEQAADETKRAMQAAAFTAYQLGAGTTKGGHKAGWMEYLRGLGLADRPEPISDEEREEIKKRGLAVAAKIDAKIKRNK